MKIDVWKGNWVSNYSIKEALDIPDDKFKGCTTTLNKYIKDGYVYWSQHLVEWVNLVGFGTSNVLIGEEEDTLFGCQISGVFLCLIYI